MTNILKSVAVLAVITFGLSACGNTIRGVGQDTANTVDATQNAGKRVNNAASY